MLLNAAHDLQAQLDSEHVFARQRIMELGESAARSSSEAVDQIVNLVEVKRFKPFLQKEIAYNLNFLWQSTKLQETRTTTQMRYSG